jgi:hypothetical protein
VRRCPTALHLVDGIPDIPDTASKTNPHGMAIKFKLPSGLEMLSPRRVAESGLDIYLYKNRVIQVI